MIKKLLLVLLLKFSITFSGISQQWFQLNNDSAALLANANMLTDQFNNDIKSIYPGITFDPYCVINTKPYLIFYGNNKVNLPLWDQLPTESKKFFITVGKNDKKAKKIFGLFFNGFYLPHELGHAVQKTLDLKVSENRYNSEYQANIIAMLWWRKTGRKKDLKKCYKAAREILEQLKNPVPPGKTMAEYFTENYDAAGRDPFIYGYMQFGQFVEIYENKSFGDFDSYIKTMKTL